MKSEYRVVVIGGGVVGASVLYHLAKLGWSDIAIVERSVLTAGSSWHAAGGVHALNADPNIAALQAYTIDLLSEIEQESGQNIGMHMTGGSRWHRRRSGGSGCRRPIAIYQTMGIEDVRLMEPAEIKEWCPIINLDGVLGGLWADREGYIDPSARRSCLCQGRPGTGRRGHRAQPGARPQPPRRRLLGRGHRAGNDRRRACRQRRRSLGQAGRADGRGRASALAAGAPLPITEQIPELAALDFEMPMMIDLEGFTYMRQELNGLLVGIYEVNHKHWNMDGAPWDYGLELIPPDVDRISDELAMAMSRYPVLRTTGINRWVNGAFTFSPDGNPLVGPVPGLRNYWSACA